jgi:COP9 signalosome complex subunit 1
MYLHDHTVSLFGKIRTKLILQYFQPFSVIDISKMAHSFNVGVSEMEKELVKLIEDGAIDARIDSIRKVNQIILYFRL